MAYELNTYELAKFLAEDCGAILESKFDFDPEGQGFVRHLAQLIQDHAEQEIAEYMERKAAVSRHDKHDTWEEYRGEK